ncbi:hypothetical protein EIP86_000080 [Pleurotus ostreatoroseus]|nr:hypothetical protein EIP86_000080 [Pleurotus ostreatoroseus]
MPSGSSRPTDQENGASVTPARMIREPHATSNRNDGDTSSPRDFGLLSVTANSVSPLSRAGLLQPKSYVSSTSRASRSRHSGIPHVQEDIRDSTMQLSSIPFRSPMSAQESFVWPAVVAPPPEVGSLPSITTSFSSALPPEQRDSEHDPIDIVVSGASSSTNTAATTPRGPGGSFHPSGLSLLLARQAETATPRLSTEQLLTPTLERPPDVGSVSTQSIAPSVSTQDTRDIDAASAPPLHSGLEQERAPLLSDLENALPSYTGQGGPVGSTDFVQMNGHTTPEAVSKRTARGVLAGWQYRALRSSSMAGCRDVAVTAVRSLPAVLLGTLLNILDGVSYGMISFPAAGVFVGLGGVGVSMFFVTAIVSQLVYSFGGSGFAGANGSMMIEVVPFFHILANDISAIVGEDKPHEVIATTIVSFAISSLITGLTFFLLGALRLGSLIGFFPRHILVGCIGGVGVFLIITGEEDFSLSLSTLKYLCLNVHTLVLWLPAFALAVLLRIITHKFHHQLIFPIYFLIIPSIFYVVVAAARINLQTLRDSGWLFQMSTIDEPWYKFYTLYDFRATSWRAIWATIPTQLAM